jgi:HTH-type transcriptional regulator/antitoxin HigA
VESDYAESAGEFLAEELGARDMTQRALAAVMGRSPKVVNEIIAGKKAITAETALQLESALGISALFWLNTQVRYDLVQARARVRSAKESTRTHRL